MWGTGLVCMGYAFSSIILYFPQQFLQIQIQLWIQKHICFLLVTKCINFATLKNENIGKNQQRREFISPQKSMLPSSIYSRPPHFHCRQRECTEFSEWGCLNPMRGWEGKRGRGNRNNFKKKHQHECGSDPWSPPGKSRRKALAFCRTCPVPGSGAFYMEHGSSAIHSAGVTPFLTQASMMANFMCYLDWTTGCSDSWQHIICACIYEGISRWN